MATECWAIVSDSGDVCVFSCAFAMWDAWKQFLAANRDYGDFGAAEDAGWRAVRVEIRLPQGAKEK